MSLVEVRMPADEQEGTAAAIGTWLKLPGDTVKESEPLLEISTDKVTLEVPAPASGTLLSCARQAGDAVRPGEVLGIITTDARLLDAEAPLEAGTVVTRDATMTVNSVEQQAASIEGGFSPVVRRLLAELGLNPRDIAKTSRGGRLTPEDIKAHLLNETATAKDPPQRSTRTEARHGRLVPHTPMRRAIARHMAESVLAAPHVTAVFEADMSQVLIHREGMKQAGAVEVPSITAYLIRAAVQAIRKVPEVNSRWHNDALEIFDGVDFGIGTAIEGGGLVVPVIRNAESKSLAEIGALVRELTMQARSGRLQREDMEGGTFTLSNHGVSGSLLAAPIILPNGQAAILGTGKVQKRVVVSETSGRELFRVRPMAYVTLTVDHRVLDAQQTNAFLSAFVNALEAPEQ